MDELYHPPLTVAMKGIISYIDQNNFLYQTVNMFFSAVKLGIITWGGGGGGGVCDGKN